MAAVSILPSGELAARAKINLALHVTGRRADGYHELDSIVVFAREADRLTLSPSEHDALELGGPFGRMIPAGSDNIVLKALAAARAVLRHEGRDLAPQSVCLLKNLPPASGIGGGSADAAAVLRAVAVANPELAEALREAGLRLGADVPMCMDGVSARVRGVGERSETILITSAVHVLLVNARVEVSTPAVFAALASRDNPGLPTPPSGGFADTSTLVDYLRDCRNDLADAAIALAPAIGDTIRAVESENALLTRMSGSGATVFGLYADVNACRDAAARIAKMKPDWWVRATSLTTDADNG